MRSAGAHSHLQGQVHSVGVYRIEEDGRIADQHVSLAGEPGGSVREVRHRLQWRSRRRAPQAIGHEGAGLHEGAEELLGGPGSPPSGGGIHDGPDAGHSTGQGNDPEPAPVEHRGNQVALVRSGLPDDAVEVSPDGDLVEPEIAPAEAKAVGDERIATAGVDDDRRAELTPPEPPERPSGRRPLDRHPARAPRRPCPRAPRRPPRGHDPGECGRTSTAEPGTCRAFAADPGSATGGTGRTRPEGEVRLPPRLTWKAARSIFSSRPRSASRSFTPGTRDSPT